jgi:hypothetical protein
LKTRRLNSSAKAVVLSDGKAGTVQKIWLDEFQGLRISIKGHGPSQQSNSRKIRALHKLDQVEKPTVTNERVAVRSRASLLPARRLRSSAPATKPFPRTDETILKPTDLYQWAGWVSVSVRIGPMLEAAAAVLVLLSAGIFLAHAVDAYQAR